MTEPIRLETGEKSRVRPALLEDTECVVAMCRRQHAEEGYLFTLSDDRVRACVGRALYPQDNAFGILGVIGAPGDLRASVYMELSQPWYSESWSLHELWTYVLPEHRASSNARDLIAYMKHAETALGVPLVTSTVSTDQTASKVRLYRKAFGEPVGAIFLHSSAGRA